MAPAGCTGPDSAALRPNIVLIHVDDLGWADVGRYGSSYYETPNIDRLAAQGMTFTQAYAAAAICSPSRAALLTGRYPARLGITDWIRAEFQGGTLPEPGVAVPAVEGDSTKRLLVPRNPLYLDKEEQTLAELLKPRGYTSMHIGKWHLGPEGWYPEDQGFDFNAGGCDYGQPPSYFDPYYRDRQGGIPNLPPRREGEYLTDREADVAAQFIRTHRDAPFFLYLAHYAVHTPIQAKDSLIAKYEARPKTNQTNPTYAAMIESVDDAVGHVLEVLEQEGLRENTLILFTSDNGGLEPITDNAPLRDGKGSPFEGGIRVPLIVAWPGHVPAGRTSDVPVSGIDYFPTLADIVGAEPGRVVDGRSLWPLLADDATDLGRTDLFWHFPHYRTRQVGPYSIVRSGDWKLIRYEDPEPYGVPRVQVFNLAADPGEQADRAPENPERVQALEARLDAWLTDVGARRPEPNPEYIAS